MPFIILSQDIFCQNTLVKEDLIVKKFIIENFKVPDHRSRFYDSTFYSKEVFLNPEGYKLKLYRFEESFYYSPFVIKITDKKDSLIMLFTFTDELYQNQNSKIHISLGDLKVYSDKDRISNYRENLEANLNELIRKLNYQKEPKRIKNLIDLIFLDLLNTKEIDTEQIKMINSKLSKVKSKKPEVIEFIKEFSKFEVDCNISLGCYNANEGAHGYWRISLDETNKEVRVKFLGSLIYRQIYL